MTHNVKLLIEYDGTDYHGWQRQASPHGAEGDLHKTIQGTIEDVLSRIIRQPAKIVAAGRTDAGVHAAGQVIHFKSVLQINESSWVKAINSLLPEDIVVRKAEYVHDGFNARFDAKSKVYKYFILNSPVPLSFQRNYMWHIKYPLDVSLMEKASQYLIGRHDFSSFRASDCSSRSPVKTLGRLEVDVVTFTTECGFIRPSVPEVKAGAASSCSAAPGKEKDRIISFTFEARSYLQHMVRNIVGTLAEVGRGKTPPSDIDKILEKRDRRYAGPIAPPHGLYLDEVRY